MTKKIVVHPGEILQEDFLKPLNLSEENLAQDIKVVPKIIHQLVKQERDLDKELATRLALYFNMSTEFWLDVQHDYEQDCVKDLRISLNKEITPYLVKTTN
jgi:addiction module HigA family antidote